MQGAWSSGQGRLGAEHYRRPSLAIHAKAAQSQGEVPRKFPSFAPSVLREDVSDWFEHETDSPYMLLVADVRKDRRRAMTKAEDALFGIDKLNVPRSSVPAITHVDYSARIQTVHKDTNPRYHAVISRFGIRRAVRWW